MAQLPILLLHGRDAGEQRLRDAAEHVLHHWPGQPPPLQTAPAFDAATDRQLLRSAGVVWLWIESEDDELFELLDRLTTHHLPVMFTGPRVESTPGVPLYEGVLAAPPHTDPALLAAMLAALYSQAHSLASLRAEAELLRLHDAGMVDQMNKVDEELRMAAQLQREFLPVALPQIESLQFGVMWRPAGYVSGDIYDVQRLDDDHVGMFIADAVGHGVPAALMTVSIKRSLVTMTDPQSDGRRRIVPPGHMLDALNREMTRHQGEKIRFATAAYAVINLRTLRATVARAGHPFPMLLRAGGATELIQPDGGVLGVFENQTFEQVDVQLEPGDRLLLYSDGFELAFPEVADPQTGKLQRVATNRYAQEFEKLREGSLDKAVAQLGDTIDRQIGSLNQRDDLTVLAAAVSPVCEPVAQSTNPALRSNS